MKKRFNSSDINQKHSNELSKKLYRTITDQSKYLDDARSSARNIEDLFAPTLLIKRRKLCEYCERLIFSDPSLYGKKGEELLWRKVFYDPVSTAKRIKKGNYTEDENACLKNHINSGVGFYHHFISKIQTIFNVKLDNVVDFLKNDENDEINNENKDLEWASMSIHQSLMYLGDLSRYEHELMNSSEKTPIRYYLQAISYRPEFGMPYNQMGTLAMNKDNNLEAVYNYMCCLACKYPFEGTLNNLIGLFEKNSKYIEQIPQETKDDDCLVVLSKNDLVKRFIARFLLLIDIWYFDKNVPKVYNLCHSTFKDLGDCLGFFKDFTEIDSTESENFALNNEILFKITIICLLCLKKLQQTNNSQISTVTAFTLAIYSQFIQNIINHIRLSVLNYPLTESKHKIKLRRRKLNKNSTNSEESSSDEEDNISISSSDSFISDHEDVLANSSEDEVIEEDDKKLSNGFSEKTESNEIKQTEEAFKKVKKMDVNDMIEIISEEGLLQSIKILNDWLTNDDLTILKSCCTNTRSLLRQITNLLNLINVDVESKKLTGIDNLKPALSNIEKINSTFPLPEDIILKCSDFFTVYHKNLDWNNVNAPKTFNLKEETIIRIIKLKQFGRFLTTLPETGITYNEKEKMYLCEVGDEDMKKIEETTFQELQVIAEQQPINGKVKDESSTFNNPKGQLIKMKHMGQLWLASEVRALENRVKGKASLSPYLVLDADALIKYNFMVKHLVHSRKFIVVVPNAVLSVLDDLKKEKSEARDAIRWLEAQFHRGNRFFRSQRPQERSPIPFIKYPKKKDKEMHIYIQIIECCYYLAEQQKGATNLITLLVGNHNLLTNGENKEFSYVGLAQTAGIAIESITQFYGKSKKSSKENR